MRTRNESLRTRQGQTIIIALIVLGVLLGLVGTDVNSGAQRFTFGLPQLADGIGIVGVAMGARGATASSEAADVVITVDRLEVRVSDPAHADGARVADG